MEHCNLLSRVNLQVDDSVPEAVFEIFSELGRLGSEPAAPATRRVPRLGIAQIYQNENRAISSSRAVVFHLSWKALHA
ncbi:hypothetical protein ABH908_000179 [Pseudomonas frederiksbergensis]|jgi:hypothetical protein